MAKRILILGGGAGGIVAANNLVKHLKGRKDVEITLVDKTGYHLFYPSLLWVMTGTREPEDIMRPLSLLERKGIKVVVDEVKRIDAENNSVELANGKLDYDYLIVALGSTPVPEKMEGWEYVCSPWTVKGALRCREKIAGFKGGNVLVGPYSWPYKCPPAPFEVAFMLRYLAEQRGIDNVNITVFHMWSQPMEPFGPLMVEGFKKFMGMYGIGFRGKLEVERIEEGRILFRNGESMDYDLAVVVPPHEPPAPVAESDLAKPETGGYMNVELKTLRHPKYRNVFGIGDIIEPTIGLGMAGIFAHFQAEFVASQIIDEITGVYMGEHYNMTGSCVMDMGYLGAAVFCDFSKKLLGQADYPDCYMIGGMKAFRALKIVFERFWLNRWF